MISAFIWQSDEDDTWHLSIHAPDAAVNRSSKNPAALASFANKWAADRSVDVDLSMLLFHQKVTV